MKTERAKPLEYYSNDTILFIPRGNVFHRLTYGHLSATDQPDHHTPSSMKGSEYSNQAQDIVYYKTETHKKTQGRQWGTLPSRPQPKRT